MGRFLLILCLCLSSFVAAAGDESWPSFRGPGARGVSEAAAPTTWDLKEGKHVLWKQAIPGLAHSSPVVWGDRIYLTTSVPAEADDELKVGLYGDIAPVKNEVVQDFQVMALDRKTGNVVWQKSAFRGVPKIKRHTKATHANSTPATDGKRVAAFFGSEGLYVYDTKGKLLWKKDFGLLDSGFFMVPQAQWGFGSSPIFHEDKLLVLADVQKGSFLAAFDAKSGKELWRTERSDVPTWGTPTVIEAGGRKQVVVNGFKHMGGYDLATGKELWKLHGTGDIPVPTPFEAHGLIYVSQAHGPGNPVYAIKPGATGDITLAEGATSNDHVAWSVPRGGSYMPTPIIVGDLLYVCRDNGALTVYRAKSGEQVYRQRLGKGAAYTASAVAAGDKVYFTSEDGDVYVVKAGETYHEVAVNALDEVTLASPAVADGTLYFRTRGHLIAIGAKK